MSSQPPDNDDLRDDGVASAWRDESNEAPSAALDAAIRAAARSELGASARVKPRSNRWLPLAVAATVAALAFGVLRWLPPGSYDVAPRRTTDPVSESRTLESPPAPTVPPTRPSDSAAAYDAAPTAEPPIERGREEAALIAAPADANAAQTKSSAPDRTSPAAGIAAESMSRGTASGAPAAAEAAAVSAYREPQAWINEIEALHAARHYDVAAARLREFRRSYADADERLPQKLREWATTVKD